MDSSAESDDWVQRRTPRACKLCRKKKVRCDGGQPACAQCVIHKSDCVYLPRAARAKQRVPGERRRSVHQTNSRQQLGPCSNCSSGSGTSIRSAGRQQNQQQQQQHEIGPANEPGLTNSASRLPTTPEEISFLLHGDGGIHDEFQPNEAERGPQTGQEVIHCASVSLSQEPESPDSGDAANGAEGMAENLALGAILDDTSMLQRLQFDHSHEALMNANNPGIANLDVNFTSLLDPDLMMDSEAGRMGASFATHAAFDNAMDLDDPRPEGHAPSDDAEDIGHSLQTTLVGHMKYMGPNMSFIPATEPGQEWITRITGTQYFSNQIHYFLEKWTPVSNAADEQQAYDYMALPTYENAIPYVNAYFAQVQCAFPILDEAEFLEQLEATYDTLIPSKDPTWCAMVNVVLAIGCRSSPGTEETLYCALFNNALSLYSQVSLGWSRIKKVQTLVLMYIFLSHTTSPHWGYTLLSCAVSESYAMGLHIKPMKSWSLTSSEQARRSLLFWSIFCLDAQLLSRLGRPPLLRLQEVSVPMPDDAMMSIAFSTQPSYHPRSGLDALEWGRLFTKNINSSRLLLDVHECIFASQELRDLTPRIAKLETKITNVSPSTLSARHEPTEGSAMLCTQDVQKSIWLPHAIVQSNIYIAKWTLRLRSIGLRISQDLEDMKRGIRDAESGRSAAFDEDIRVACGGAANLIRLISSVPEGDYSSAHWYLAPLPVFALYVLFLGILYRPLHEDSAVRMELMSIVVESTVDGANMPHPLVSDLHLPHFLTFFSRTARIAILRARQGQSPGGRT